MKKTSSILLASLSIFLFTPCEASGLPLEEIPEAETEAKILTALKAIRYAKTLSTTDKKGFFIEFTKNPKTNLREVSILAQHVDRETAADLYETYVARSDSTKTTILATSQLMSSLGKEYKPRALGLKDVADSILK